MTMPFALYMAAWVAACLAAAYLIARHRQRLELCHARYWRFLLQDWKVLSFSIAAACLTVIAPYSDDYTWDYVDAPVMSVLAFVTGPWAVGTLYRALRRRAVDQRVHRALRLAVFGELVLRSVYRAERRLVLALLAAEPVSFLDPVYLRRTLLELGVATGAGCAVSVHPTPLAGARCRQESRQDLLVRFAPHDHRRHGDSAVPALRRLASCRRRKRVVQSQVGHTQSGLVATKARSISREVTRHST